MPTFIPTDSSVPGPHDPGETSSGNELGVLAAGDPIPELVTCFQSPADRPHPPNQPPPPPDLGPRYLIDVEIASGAMGVVCRGRDADLGRDVAVKILLGSHLGKAELRRRFVVEAQLTSSLQHPAVPAVYEVGELRDGRPYYIMQLVRGRTLADILADRADPRANLSPLLRIFQSLCGGVAYAHAAGVIHRDIKPANMMIADFDVVKVMDWGVAKILPHSPFAAVIELPPAAPPGDPPDDLLGVQTQLGRVFGTPAYMSPEQAHGLIDLLDERTDVFGLGGILCAILTGHPPYSGNCGQTAFRRAYEADLADAFGRLDRSGTDPALVALCKRCLAAERADRPRDAGALSSELIEYLDYDLRRTERDLIRFFELSPDLFCIAGLNGYFRRVNPNFTRVLGYSPAELLSRPFIEFVHPLDRPRTLNEMKKIAAYLPCSRFLNRYRDVNGAYRWFEWSAKQIPEEGIIFAIARDVTDRLELEYELRGMRKSDRPQPEA